jgi:adenylate cyclase
MLRGDMIKSVYYQERALLLNPNDDRIVCAMGEILTTTGSPLEAIGWVRRAMRLNPYHPPGHWYHLARAQYHAGAAADAVKTLANVLNPSLRDNVLLAAAAVECEQSAVMHAAVRAISEQRPEFEVATFLRRIPYVRESDREQWRAALARAGLR